MIMAEVRGKYTAINKLKAHGKDAKDLIYGINRVKMAWINGTKVWDVWETLLSASNASISSSYTELTKSILNIQSYGTDGLGVNRDMDYTINPTSISANTSESSKTHSVQITQTNSGKSVSVTATQAGRVLSRTTYSTPTVTSTSISTVPASGNVTRYLSVGWSQTKTLHYDNGTTSSSTVTGTSTATITNGSSSVDAYINDGGVYVPSAGTTHYTSDRVAYTITQFNFSANGVSSGNVNNTVYLYQSANNYSVAYYEYTVSATPSVSSIGAIGGSFTISASCQAREVRSFTSGSTGYGGWFNSSANVEPVSNIAGSSPSSFTGSTTISVTVGENTGSARNAIMRVRSTGNTGVYKEVSVYQSAVSYEFYSNNKTVEVAASVTRVTITGVSKRNGAALSITTGNISFGSYSVGNPGIESVSNSNGTFSIVVSFNSNGDSTSSKYLNLTVTQPGSGNTITFNITQQKNPVQVNYLSWIEGFGYYTPGTTKKFTARLRFDSSIEGSYLQVQLLDGSNVIKTETFQLISSEWGSATPWMTIEMQYTTSSYGPFYFKASYGGDTETIQLQENFSPLSLRRTDDNEEEIKEE